MNPARSLEPALVSGELGQAWIFLAGPLAGALLAVVLASALRRPQLIWPPRVVVDSKRQKSASAALRRQNDESCGQGRHDHPRDLGDRCPDDTGEHAARLMSQHGVERLPGPVSPQADAPGDARFGRLPPGLWNERGRVPAADIAGRVGGIAYVGQYGLRAAGLSAVLRMNARLVPRARVGPPATTRSASARTAGPARDTGDDVGIETPRLDGYHPLPMVPVSRLYAVPSASRSIAG